MDARILADKAVSIGLDLGDPRIAHTVWLLEAADAVAKAAADSRISLKEINATATKVSEQVRQSSEVAKRIPEDFKLAIAGGIKQASAVGQTIADDIARQLRDEVKRAVRSREVLSYSLLAGLVLAAVSACVAVGYTWGSSSSGSRAAPAQLIANCAPITGGHVVKGADGHTYCQNTWRLD